LLSNRQAYPQKSSTDSNSLAQSYAVLVGKAVDATILLKSVLENMKKDAQVATDVPLDRVADLSLLREIRAELQGKVHR